MRIDNKKAQTIGIIVFLMLGIVSIIALYVVFVPLSKVWGDISAEFHNSSVIDDGTFKGNNTLSKLEQFDSLLTGEKNILDQFIFIGFIGMMLALFVFALFFSDHPIFIVFLILGIIVVVLLSSQLVNFAEKTINNAELNNTADDFKLSNVILGNQLPLIVLIMGAITILIVISRRSGGIGG